MVMKREERFSPFFFFCVKTHISSTEKVGTPQCDIVCAGKRRRMLFLRLQKKRYFAVKKGEKYEREKSQLPATKVAGLSRTDLRLMSVHMY
jgi:hypothetical protein